MKNLLMTAAMIMASFYSVSAMDVSEQVGQTFVDFSLYDINGEVVESDVHRKNKIVVMKIGQLSCPICSEVLSSLGKIDKEYQAKGVAFIDVTFDEDVTELKKHADEYDVDFPTLIDANGDLATYYDINPIPVTIFASKEGKIIRYVIGRLSEEEIRSTLDEALK